MSQDQQNRPADEHGSREQLIRELSETKARLAAAERRNGELSRELGGFNSRHAAGNERLYRALAANLPQGAVFLVDRDLRFVSAEGQGLRAMGMAPSDLEGKTIEEAIDPDLAVLYEPHYRRALEGEPFTVRHDFNGRHYLTNGTPLKNTQGRIYAVLAVSFDITEQRRMEAELERISQFPKENPNPVMRMTRDGTILYANTAAQEWLATMEQQEKKTLPDVLQEAVVQAFRRDRQVEVEISNPTGRIFVFFAVRPVGEDYVNLYGIDFTERKMAEEALRESEERFRLALRNAPISVAAQDLELRYTWAYNQRTAPPGGVVGKRDSDIFTAEETERLGAIKRRVIAENVEIREQLWLDRPSGLIFLDAYFAPIRDSAGQVIGVGVAAVDLTPIKLAEEAAQESRIRLEAALASMTDAVFISDDQGRLIEFNDAFATFHRFKDKSECATTLAEYPDFLEVYLDNGDLARLDQWAVPRALRGEKVTRAEYTLRRKDTGATWVGSYSFAPIRDKDGAITGSVVVGRDITDLKQAQKELAASERNYRELVETANSVILRWDNKGVIKFVNAYGLRFFGYSAEELLGRDVMTIIPKVEKSTGRDLDALVKDTLIHPERHTCVPNQNIRKDGKTVWVAWTNKAILDERGNVLEILAVGNDITALKQTEAALRETGESARQRAREAEEREQVLTAMMDHIPMGITIADAPDVTIRAVSRFGRELTGWSRERIEGIPVDRRAQRWEIYRSDGVTPASNEELPLTRATVNGENVRDEVWVLGRDDGKRIPILCTAAPIRDAQGRITGGVIGWQDITELKMAEEALRSSEERLKASLTEKEVLLKEIHHRVKNNMQIISSLVSLQANESQDPAMREALRDVTNRVRSMAMVHEKLYQSHDLARIDFADYIKSLLNYLWRAQQSAAGVRLDLDLEPTLLPVNLAVPCGLILNELFSNALKHAFAGRDSGQVIVSLHGNDQGRLRLSVRDSGVGLPPGFDWKQSRSLGLRLTQMLAGQLRASIEVTSDKGTEFAIIFERPKT